MQRHLALLLVASVASALSAQSNTVLGLDGRLEILDNITYWGRRGAAFPNGEVGLSMRNTMCNPGSVNIPWFAQMAENHPKFGFLITRLSNGRMEQISDRSYCKHAFTSASTAGACGPCIPNIGGTLMGVGCSDTYSAGNNGSRNNLGPADEIDPWLGTWNHIGSYFDQGDPNVGAPGNIDGNQSPINVGSDAVKNRVTVKELDLQTPGASYFYGIQLIHQGESVANRGDNIKSRGFVPTFSGSSLNVVNSSVGEVFGSILQHWTGATVNSGGNGNDDGRFFVGSKATPISGGFHYEYAIHNVDNSRGGAVFRVPVAAAATASNFTFRDIDDNALNQWTAARVGNEIVFTAPANNPQNWNTIFNFAFDCTQSPSQGLVVIDEARPGPGNLQITVFADVPSGAPTAFNTSVGTGCAGFCRASVYELFTSPASFDLANSSMGLSFNGQEYTLGAASGTFVTPTGINLGLGNDTTSTITMPFPVSFPGGSTTQIVVCANGFISPAANGNSPTATTGEFLSAGARWALAWHDLNPAAGGQVLASVSPTVVRISWSGVPSASGTGSHTFQAEFLPNNQVNYYWSAMSTSGNAYLVGWTAGNDSVALGSSDLSALIPAGNTTLCPDSNDLPPLSLSAGSRPVLGTTVAMTTSDIPANTGAQGLVYSLAPVSPAIDLTPLGMETCFAHMATFDVFALNAAPGTSRIDNVPVPNQPSLVGVTVVMQAVAYSPPRTTLGWVTSNAILMFLAAQ